MFVRSHIRFILLSVFALNKFALLLELKLFYKVLKQYTFRQIVIAYIFVILSEIWIRLFIKIKSLFTRNKEVIKQWTNIANKTRIQFTLQALNLFNVYDFVYWVSKTSIPVDANNVYSNWAEINNLPVDIRHKEIERVLCINDKDVQRVLNDSHKSLRKCLEAHLNDTTIGSIHTLARTTKLFDMARNQHIKDYIPEVYSCIKAEYNENQYI